MDKKYLVILLFQMLASAQVVNFSDLNLKNKLLQASTNNSIALDANNNKIQIDINNDREIEINEALLVYTIDISNSDISNLNGLEFFSNISNLICSNNNITNFNFVQFPNIVNFYGNNNLLTSLSIDNNKNIDTIELRNNQLNSVSVTNCNNLWGLDCSNNNIISLDIKNLPNLFDFSFSNNSISNFNFTNLTNLTIVNFSNNLLTNLTFSNCPNIRRVICHNNLLTTLDFSNLNLLERIGCYDNRLSSINLTGCTSLHTLFSSNNNLSSLDCSSCLSLDVIDCQNNQLTYLNVKNGIHETSYGICGNPNLKYICVDNDPAEINHMALQVGSSYCGYSNVTINPNCSLNVNSFDLRLNFDIFPNPTQNTLNISSSSYFNIKSIKIYNTIGKLILVKTNSNKQELLKIDVSSLSPGVYYTFIDSEKGITTEKFIKN
tara:strand:+ start:2126 stop:3430 length:1305 start_codon:yes stop_codon:yes gene_type:complete